MNVKNKCKSCGKEKKVYITGMKAARKIKRNHLENNKVCNICTFRKLVKENIRGVFNG